MADPIKTWKERIDYSEPPTIKRMNDAMLAEIAELRAALAQKDSEITYHQNHFANLKIEYDDLYDEHEKLEAALAAPREPMPPEPVARVTGYHAGRCIIEPLDRVSVFPVGMAVYAHPAPVKPPNTFGMEEWQVHALRAGWKAPETRNYSIIEDGGV